VAVGKVLERVLDQVFLFFRTPPSNDEYEQYDGGRTSERQTCVSRES
jgi:hypothetical protein